jgi:hypothetical protein
MEPILEIQWDLSAWMFGCLGAELRPGVKQAVGTKGIDVQSTTMQREEPRE